MCVLQMILRLSPQTSEVTFARITVVINHSSEAANKTSMSVSSGSLLHKLTSVKRLTVMLTVFAFFVFI